MTDHKWLACLAVGLFCLATTGCVTPYVYRCDECGDDSISGRYGEAGGCGAGCEDCAECGGACDEPFCGHTLTGVIKRSATCNAGCGEIYWGEWINDPPADCDPCSNHGDWIGQACCGPGVWGTLWAGLHGTRCGYGGPMESGCDDCDDGASSGELGETIEMLDPASGPISEPEPVEVPATVSRRSTDSYYTPHPLSRLKHPARR